MRNAEKARSGLNRGKHVSFRLAAAGVNVTSRMALLAPREQGTVSRYANGAPSAGIGRKA
jgi:hypothetical protein